MAMEIKPLYPRAVLETKKVQMIGQIRFEPEDHSSQLTKMSLLTIKLHSVLFGETNHSPLDPESLQTPMPTENRWQLEELCRCVGHSEVNYMGKRVWEVCSEFGEQSPGFAILSDVCMRYFWGFEHLQDRKSS